MLENVNRCPHVGSGSSAGVTGIETAVLHLVTSAGLVLEQHCGEPLAPHRLSMAGNDAVPHSSVLLQLSCQGIPHLIIWLLQ